MKFSCDSCGAQYQIADEKLGQRGVKVRCKKCSYVIILRPPDDTLSAGDPAELSGGTPLAESPVRPKIEPRIEPKVERQPVTAPPTSVHVSGKKRDPAALAGELLAETSSDFGLSQEFAALGFEDPGHTTRARTSLGDLDLPAPDLGLSPFSDVGSGGSLDDEPPRAVAGPTLRFDAVPALGGVEATTRSLGVSLPSQEEDGFEATRIEARRTEVLRSDEPKSEEFPRARASAMEPGDLGEAQTPPPDVEWKAPTPAWASPREEPTSPRVAVPEDDEDASLASLSQAFSGLERNELEEMRATMDDAMAGLSSQVAEWADSEPKPDPKTVVAPRPPEVAAPAPKAAPKPATESESFLGSGVEEEIGDAFDAMFGGEQVPSEEFQEEPAVNTEMAARPRAAAPEGDRLQTRVFDTEAMALAQAEQERASVPAPVKPVVVPRSNAAEWYVAINDEQVGPLTLDQVQMHWENRAISAASLCWRQGMDDWTNLSASPLFALLPERDDLEETVAAPEIKEEVVVPPAISLSKPAPPPVEDEPVWKPSAASLLASLAAEEVAPPAPAPKSDIAVGPALPALSALGAPSALEKLLEGEPKGPAATMFGAAEKSESAVKPLPRRPDTINSAPLRDPSISRPKSQPAWILPATIFAGLLVVAGAVYAALGRNEAPAPTMQGQVSVTPQNPPPVTPPPVTPPPPAPVEVAAVVPPPPPAVEPPVAPPPPVVTPEPVAEPPPTKKGPKKGRDRTERTERTERVERPPPEPPRRVEPPPPPAPPPPAASEEDDLLGVAKQKKRLPVAQENTNLPDQLEDSDILGVLRKQRNDVRGCLEKQSSADPSLEGTMTVKLLVQNSGNPSQVTIGPDKFKGSVVAKCVSAAVKSWKFPQFSGRAMNIDFPVHVRGQ